MSQTYSPDNRHVPKTVDEALLLKTKPIRTRHLDFTSLLYTYQFAYFANVKRETQLSSACRDLWQSIKIEQLLFLEIHLSLARTLLGSLKAVLNDRFAVTLWVDSGISDRSIFVLRAWHSLRTAARVADEIE